jgi:hypothetical protein
MVLSYRFSTAGCCDTSSLQRVLTTNSHVDAAVGEAFFSLTIDDMPLR